MELVHSNVHEFEEILSAEFQSDVEIFIHADPCLDDVDDTAMIYLTSSPTKDEAKWLKEKLILHANLTKLQVKNTYADYRNLRAYSTWFGKNMYIEFDACVLANLMYWVYESQLPLNQHDEASLTYIRSVIETNRYLLEPFRCAHEYPRTVPIIYRGIS